MDPAFGDRKRIVSVQKELLHPPFNCGNGQDGLHFTRGIPFLDAPRYSLTSGVYPMRNTTRLFSRTMLLVALLLAAPVSALASVQVQVNGNTATAAIELPGNLDADLTLSFDSASNLSASSLGIQAQVVSPLDNSILSRLPGINVTSITSAFPVLITIEPPAGGNLQFTNTYRIELHTHALQYAPGIRVRLFKAPIGGNFHDITESVEPGSIRARGRGGAFSQFLFVLDTRATSQIAQAKLDALNDIIDTGATLLPPTTLAQLRGATNRIQQAIQGNDTTQALDSLDALQAQALSLAGTALPNLWIAGGSVDNVAGRMLSEIATLRFSLQYLRDYGN